MKKCREYRVEGRRPVGRPRKTWLGSVEADMAKLEIDKEDVHDIDRSKWRKECEFYKEEVQPYRKMDYKPIIYNCMSDHNIIDTNIIIYMISKKSGHSALVFSQSAMHFTNIYFI